MTIKDIKKPKERFEVAYCRRLSVQQWGDNNLYPQELRNVINSSRNGRTCVDRKAAYVEGNGLASQALSAFVCNIAGDAVDDVLHAISEDVAYYDAFALHVNYDVQGRIVSVAHVPFEQCRLAEPDSYGVVREVLLHPDWVGNTTRNGNRVRVNEEAVERFPVFDPRPGVVMREIERAGGIDGYRGQIVYISRAGRNAYPMPIADVIIPDMSTDEGLATISHRNVRCNFTPAGMLILKRGQGANSDNDDTAEQVARLQGDEKTGKILVAEIDTPEDKPEFVNFSGENYDKAFTETAKDVVDNIYAVFNQEGFARLRTGSIGFTGDLINDVKVEYAQQVKRYQRMISRTLKVIFENWASGAPYAGAADVEIEPLYQATNEATDYTR